MKGVIQSLSAILVLNLASGCGSHHDGDDDVSALRGQVQAARTEVGRHHDAALAAPTLSALMTEVDHHDTRMSGIMDGMNGRMGGMMSHCSGSGMMRMRGMMGDLETAMDSHRADMRDMPALEEAREQCSAHTESMNGMLDGMHAALDSMGCMDR
jgi:hypothetical protein